MVHGDYLPGHLHGTGGLPAPARDPVCCRRGHHRDWKNSRSIRMSSMTMVTLQLRSVGLHSAAAVSVCYNE